MLIIIPCINPNVEMIALDMFSQSVIEHKATEKAADHTIPLKSRVVSLLLEVDMTVNTHPALLGVVCSILNNHGCNGMWFP